MKILIIQERGRNQSNELYREGLRLQHGFSKHNINSIVWGLNYPNFNIPFKDISRDCDVIFVMENYLTSWIPIDEIKNCGKLKIFWSIDSHVILQSHLNICNELKIDILLNSIEHYLPKFNSHKKFYLPNAYPDELIYPIQNR